MTITGYRLAYRAKSAPTDYIPSLIGVGLEQIEPADSDAYFEQIELPAEAINLNTLSMTKWVSYDSSPADERDPIIAVKAAGTSYYIPLGDLIYLIQKQGSLASEILLTSFRKKAGI